MIPPLLLFSEVDYPLLEFDADYERTPPSSLLLKKFVNYSNPPAPV